MKQLLPAVANYPSLNQRSRNWPGPNVSRETIITQRPDLSLSDAEASEDLIQHILRINAADNAAERIGSNAELLGG